MHDFAVQYPDCVQGKDCGSPIAAYTLFIIFYVVCTYIFVNLLTVVRLNIIYEHNWMVAAHQFLYCRSSSTTSLLRLINGTNSPCLPGLI